MTKTCARFLLLVNKNVPCPVSLVTMVEYIFSFAVKSSNMSSMKVAKKSLAAGTFDAVAAAESPIGFDNLFRRAIKISFFFFKLFESRSHAILFLDPLKDWSKNCISDYFLICNSIFIIDLFIIRHFFDKW